MVRQLDDENIFNMLEERNESENNEDNENNGYNDNNQNNNDNENTDGIDNNEDILNNGFFGSSFNNNNISNISEGGNDSIQLGSNSFFFDRNNNVNRILVNVDENNLPISSLNGTNHIFGVPSNINMDSLVQTILLASSLIINVATNNRNTRRGTNILTSDGEDTMEEVIDDGMEEIDLNDDSDYIRDENPLGEYANMEYELLHGVSDNTSLSRYNGIVNDNFSFVDEEDLISFDDDATLETQSLIAHGRDSLSEIGDGEELFADIDEFPSTNDSTPRDNVVYIRGDIVLGDDEIIIENGEIIYNNNNQELFEDIPEFMETTDILQDREQVFEYNISVANQNTTNDNSFNFNAPQENTVANYNLSRFLQRYGTNTPPTQHNVSIHSDGHSLTTDNNLFNYVNSSYIRENSLYPGSFEMARYADRYQMGDTIAEGFLY
ncbi:gametocytogenesis-implicated protein, putative [Plasmodium sp. gorilla clade G2]|uniref:gametocytogenesis-implicated protein, putative n=1 Tax=Plasmodium sp. gorilla clade G2 TaxID=880535 RepID=UPI000D21B366|nr:gametocytogenesis-implicated protein, putative [Plasmodium sp. gorilla clade G2]SOV14529.1 gametocytogenesis-implicated protein, putative [Plasmodium sp. gorilla clade G2]